jgi:hypothetical protein
LGQGVENIWAKEVAEDWRNFCSTGLHNLFHTIFWVYEINNRADRVKRRYGIVLKCS